MFSMRLVQILLCTLLPLLFACDSRHPEQNGLVAIFRGEDGSVTEGIRGELFVGHTPAGRAQKARLTLKNVGETAVSLSPIESLGGARTRVPGGGDPGAPVFEVQAPGSASLDPGAQTEIEITFAPPREGRFIASVRVSSVSVTLIGLADPAPVTDRPELSLVSGEAADFGYLPWFPTAPVTMKRQVWVANSGITTRRVHRAEVEAMNAETAPAELEVWLGEDGLTLLPEAPHHAQPAELRLTPATAGEKAWRVTLFTTSPETPELVLEVRAQALAPTACPLRVTPAQLEFGVVSPRDHRNRFVEITNEGSAPSELCVIWDVALAVESSSAFALPGGAFPPTFLSRGASVIVPVRFSPPDKFPSSSGTKHEGTLTFRTNASTRPLVEIPLSGLEGSSKCITIAPDELDFGSRPMGCSSATRTFSVYNTCSEEIVVTSFRMQEAAGQPAGSAACPGTSDCPEFFLAHSPAIPSGGLVLAPGAPPQTFQVRYRPIDLGSDTGAVAINARVGEADRTFVVSLYGKGDSLPVHTDVFVQDPPPRADVLFVIDDSASMADDQASIASNLDEALQLWLSQYLDFQIGVVTASPTGSAALLTGPTHPDAVLTRATPNLQTQFADKVNVGTGGTGGPRCLERALEALTSNPGFVRSGVSLWVVCITDSADVSPLPVSDYLAAIKAAHPKTWFSFSAIGGFSAACPGDNGRLADAVAQTYGAKGNICDPTWNNALLSYAYVGWGFRMSFFLTSVPILSSGPIHVMLDGQPLAPTNPAGTTVWRYDHVANAIVFEGTAGRADAHGDVSLGLPAVAHARPRHGSRERTRSLR